MFHPPFWVGEAFGCPFNFLFHESVSLQILGKFFLFNPEMNHSCDHLIECSLWGAKKSETSRIGNWNRLGRYWLLDWVFLSGCTAKKIAPIKHWIGKGRGIDFVGEEPEDFPSPSQNSFILNHWRIGISGMVEAIWYGQFHTWSPFSRCQWVDSKSIFLLSQNFLLAVANGEK